MTELVKATDLTLRPARITEQKFTQILAAHGSPALPEAHAIWNTLVDNGVDPSFALGQFHVESLMGKAGHATVTKSWGNMLWDASLTPTRAKYSPGNGYTYARYDTWADGVVDYQKFVNHYAVTIDPRYSATVCDTIDECCARWQGDPSAAKTHDTYVQIILNLINDEFEFVPGAFVETGDKMISISSSGITSTKRYFIKNGTPLFRGTNGDVLKLAAFAGTGGNCRFLGPVNQPWSDTKWAWAAAIVNVKDKGETVIYLQNPDKTEVTSA